MTYYLAHLARAMKRELIKLITQYIYDDDDDIYSRVITLFHGTYVLLL